MNRSVSMRPRPFITPTTQASGCHSGILRGTRRSGQGFDVAVEKDLLSLVEVDAVSPFRWPTAASRTSRLRRRPRKRTCPKSTSASSPADGSGHADIGKGQCTDLLDRFDIAADAHSLTSASCSSTSRWKIRRVVWRCFFGAARLRPPRIDWTSRAERWRLVGRHLPLRRDRATREPGGPCAGAPNVQHSRTTGCAPALALRISSNSSTLTSLPWVPGSSPPVETRWTPPSLRAQWGQIR